jgi:hypothetical protein
MLYNFLFRNSSQNLLIAGQGVLTVMLMGLLGFWTFPLSGILEITKHDVSETVFVSALR